MRGVGGRGGALEGGGIGGGWRTWGGGPWHRSRSVGSVGCGMWDGDTEATGCPAAREGLTGPTGEPRIQPGASTMGTKRR